MEPLNTNNIVTIGISFSAVAGWFVNNVLQRKFEKSKERFRARFNMLKDGLDLLNSIKNHDVDQMVDYTSTVTFQSLLLKVDQNFLIYADDLELTYWKDVLQTITSGSYRDIKSKSILTIELFRKKIRKELDLEDC